MFEYKVKRTLTNLWVTVHWNANTGDVSSVGWSRTSNLAKHEEGWSRYKLKTLFCFTIKSLVLTLFLPFHLVKFIWIKTTTDFMSTDRNFSGLINSQNLWHTSIRFSREKELCRELKDWQIIEWTSKSPHHHVRFKDYKYFQRISELWNRSYSPQPHCTAQVPCLLQIQ